VGDSPTVDTGFGIVSKNLLSRLHKMGYEISVLGINHFGEPYNNEIFPYPIYPVKQGSLDEIYGYLDYCWICDKKITFWDRLTFNCVHGFEGNAHRRNCE
jgi:hypothetical protein